MTTEVRVLGVVAAEGHAPTPAPARRVVHGDVAAVVADADPDSLSPARALREQWRILEEIAENDAVLPIRFGTVLASDEAVADGFLAPARERLRAGLASLDGRAQVTVKGTYDEDALLRGVVEGSPAIARLREEVAGLPGAAGHAKRIRLGELVAAAVERCREHDGALVLARLEPLAVASRSETASGLDGAVNAAFLVERDGLDAFEAAAAALADELAGRIALRAIGPLPAYSFTSEEAGAWA